MALYLESLAKEVTSVAENPLSFLEHLFTGFVFFLSFSTFLRKLLADQYQEERITMYFQKDPSKNIFQRGFNSVLIFFNLLSSPVN